MKRNKGEVLISMVVATLIFVGIVSSHVAKGEKAPETPAVHNYNK